MLKKTLHLLGCPACRIGLQPHGPSDTGKRLMHGWLECPQCAVQVPVVQGFALLTEAAPAENAGLSQKMAELNRQLSASRDYISFVHHRHIRRIPDRYAAFQPFNESTRAFYALLDLIRGQ